MAETALIVGAGSGLSASLARIFAKAGLKVALAARRAANLAALAVLRNLQAEVRPASPDEQAVLARWSSWGSLPGVFDPADRRYEGLRAELGERLLKELGGARQPMGVRALAGELGVPPDVLAAPIRELRQAGKIRKHGDKRSTAYSLA